MSKLPTFRGYTVDVRQSEFRKMEPDKFVEFVSFQSELGKELLSAYLTKRRNKLIPQSLLKKLPPLYSQEENANPTVWCKFFFAAFEDFGWTWWGIEFDKTDTFFGLVKGHYVELGNFSLVELCTVTGMLGSPVVRDRYFKPCRLSELKAKLRAEDDVPMLVS